MVFTRVSQEAWYINHMLLLLLFCMMLSYYIHPSKGWDIYLVVGILTVTSLYICCKEHLKIRKERINIYANMKLAETTSDKICCYLQLQRRLSKRCVIAGPNDAAIAGNKRCWYCRQRVVNDAATVVTLPLKPKCC